MFDKDGGREKKEQDETCRRRRREAAEAETREICRPRFGGERVNTIDWMANTGFDID
jgi:hypothetical protein